MMRKIFFYLPFVLLTVLSTMSLASCSSDDDENGVMVGAVPSPTLTDANGNKLRVTSVGYTWFEYDETCKLKRFGDYNSTYELKGDAFIFDIEDGVTCTIAGTILKYIDTKNAALPFL